MIGALATWPIVASTVTHITSLKAALYAAKTANWTKTMQGLSQETSELILRLIQLAAMAVAGLVGWKLSEVSDWKDK
jgi:hypothetical protein